MQSFFKPLKTQSLGHTFLSNFTQIRRKSQSTAIPKKQQRVRDHGFDNYMEIEKKMRKVLKFQELITSQPNGMVTACKFDNLTRRLGLKQFEGIRFIVKHPEIFEVFEHPVQRILYCRLSRRAVEQIEWENKALAMQVQEAVIRLRKLLMLSNTGRLSLDHVRVARKDFGLPDDFEYSVVLKHPRYFRLFDDENRKCKWIEVVERDPSLAACAIEKAREREYREKGVDAEDIRFSFIVNFPPGFRLGKYYKIAVWKWQRLPYWSPYEDVSGYDMRSLEAQNRMEKRAVAMIHEIVSLTVEKKISLERIALFRVTMDLPKKLKDFLLQHQGIFYISTRGNMGKLHTIFLREAYKKGELIEPNDLYLARRKLAHLISLSRRKANEDLGVVSHRRDRRENGKAITDCDFVDCISESPTTKNEVSYAGEQKDEYVSDMDGNVSSDYTDEEDEGIENIEAEVDKSVE